MSDKRDLYTNIGTAVCILAVCLGVGGCEYLQYNGIAKVTEAKTKLIEAENAKKMLTKSVASDIVLETVKK